ncbi:MAG: hypothetical protein A2Z96_00060 [Spirochaetes bacterium GWB1_48_6]|nr:MAG: hypothetical protein A2Z96_00060 [Spirochaetes bacterium GWB1_48_6]
MKLSQLEKELELRPLQVYKDEEWESAYTSDLLSDVMGNAPGDSVLVTIQGHKNTVAVATLAGIKAIVLANGAPATADMLQAAALENIAIFSSPKDQFHLSCKIGKILNLP